MPREKTSNAEKIKRGTNQRCRMTNELSYAPLTEVPAPSFALNAHGKTYFRNFCMILLSNQTLTAADIPGITRAARWFELYCEADEVVREKGPVQVTSTGYTQQTGYYTVMEKAEDRIIKFEGLYGMNLTSRTKINVPPAKKKNEFEEI